jgi:hypothetical protein
MSEQRPGEGIQLPREYYELSPYYGPPVEVVQRPLASLEEVLDRFQATVDTLPQKIHDGVMHMSARAPKRGAVFIDALYTLRERARDDNRLAGWSETLASREAFFQAIAPEATQQRQRIFSIGMKTFVEEYLHPQRFSILDENAATARKSGQSATLEIYNATGTWLPVPHPNSSTAEVADISIIQQLFSRLKESAPVQAMYHMTTSEALPTIIKHGGLIGAAALRGRGETVKTGMLLAEASQPLNVGPHAVYAYPFVGSNDLYGTLRWFDAYPICFSIDMARFKQPTSAGSSRCATEGTSNTDSYSRAGH